MKFVTEPPWRLAGFRDLPKDQRHKVGLLVVSGPPDELVVIADCSNSKLPDLEQRSNAALLAKAVDMASALVNLEICIGDLPASNSADAAYSLIVESLREIGITPRDRHPETPDR